MGATVTTRSIEARVGNPSFTGLTIGVAAFGSAEVVSVHLTFSRLKARVATTRPFLALFFYGSSRGTSTSSRSETGISGVGGRRLTATTRRLNSSLRLVIGLKRQRYGRRSRTQGIKSSSRGWGSGA